MRLFMGTHPATSRPISCAKYRENSGYSPPFQETQVCLYGTEEQSDSTTPNVRGQIAVDLPDHQGAPGSVRLARALRRGRAGR